MPYGTAVLAVEVPDRDGSLADVALGYATAADYATGNSPYIGLTIGRYASRIAGSTITIDGETYQLAGAGFNQNFVLRRTDIPGRLTEAAVLHDPASGRTLTVLTAEPGLFLYTANFLDISRPMKGGVTYPLRAGVARDRTLS